MKQSSHNKEISEVSSGQLYITAGYFSNFYVRLIRLRFYFFQPLFDLQSRLCISKEVTTKKLVGSAVTKAERLKYFGQTQKR